jgi:hypothetical protein
MMLMMALETLIVQGPRAEAVRAHVARLKEATENSGLPRSDRQSLLTSLGWLEAESINQAGRRLARTLGDRQYMVGQPGGAEDPVKFFKRCYDLRNLLAHGKFPRPSRDEVGLRAASLEVFVADLLAGELRDFEPRSEPVVNVTSTVEDRPAIAATAQPARRRLRWLWPWRR